MLELFKDCGCEYIVVDDVFSAHLAKFEALGLVTAVPGFRGVIHIGDAAQAASKDGSYSSDDHGLTGVTYESLVSGAAAPAEDALRGGDDTYGIFYTGGTTGKSKGVEWVLLPSGTRFLFPFLPRLTPPSTPRAGSRTATYLPTRSVPSARCNSTTRRATSTPRPCSTSPTHR